jgi:hypothetical protein
MLVMPLRILIMARTVFPLTSTFHLNKITDSPSFVELLPG